MPSRSAATTESGMRGPSGVPLAGSTRSKAASRTSCGGMPRVVPSVPRPRRSSRESAGTGQSAATMGRAQAPGRQGRRFIAASRPPRAPRQGSRIAIGTMRAIASSFANAPLTGCPIVVDLSGLIDASRADRHKNRVDLARSGGSISLEKSSPGSGGRRLFSRGPPPISSAPAHMSAAGAGVPFRGAVSGGIAVDCNSPLPAGRPPALSATAGAGGSPSHRTDADRAVPRFEIRLRQGRRGPDLKAAPQISPTIHRMSRSVSETPAATAGLRSSSGRRPPDRCRWSPRRWRCGRRGLASSSATWKMIDEAVDADNLIVSRSRSVRNSFPTAPAGSSCGWRSSWSSPMT